MLLGIVVVLLVLALRPDLILSTTTPTGGDNAAHLWTADYARRELLPHLRLTGWSNDWYAGLPVLGFYFPLPAWLIVALSFVVPYAVAYKLVTVLGTVLLLPLCHRLARKASCSSTESLVFAYGALPFLLARHFRILGGNLLSTMAGEFSFSLGLALAVLYAGLLITVLRTGRGRGRAALVLAATGLCHLVPGLLAAMFTVGAVVGFAERARVRRQLSDTALVAISGGLLTGFWSLPFVGNLSLTNSMDYERNTRFLKSLVPFVSGATPTHLRTDGMAVACTALLLAAVAMVHGWVRHHGLVRSLSITMALAAVAFRIAPQGSLWNNRLLPLWWFCAYLLGAIGMLRVCEAIAALARRLRRTAPDEQPDTRQSLTGPLLATVVLYLVSGPAFSLVPGALPVPTVSNGHLSIGSYGDTVDFRNAAMPFGWATSNESGMQSKKGWREFSSLVTTLRLLPCGRALWEYDRSMESYGSAMAMMAIPYFTRSCISSMEGLYFEASPTTPFHFLTASMVTAAPSNPQRRLPYASFDLERGIDRMRALGVRYYLARSDKARTAARASSALRLVARSAPYEVYELANHAVVTPLAERPVVATGIGPGLNDGFVDVGIAAWMDPDAYPATIALDGPSDWSRVRATVHDDGTGARGASARLSASTPRSLPSVRVRKVRIQQHHVSFEVDRIGVPVLVRISWFPNWHAHGAAGPWRVAPNFMVVVPRSHQVRLDFGWSAWDHLGWVATLLGAVGVVLLRRSDRRSPRHGRRDDASASGAGLAPQGTPQDDEALDGAEDPTGHRGASGSLLLDGDADLVTGEAGTLGP